MGLLSRLGNSRRRKLTEFVDQSATSISSSWKQSVPERPNQLIATLPRAGLVVEEWKGRGTLVLRGAAGDTVRLQVPGMHRKDADELATALPGP
jgi:hypothetical protein